MKPPSGAAASKKRLSEPGAEGSAAFIARLDSMGAARRLRAARKGEFSRAERALWVARYPQEAPLVNGELEWIALGLADLDR
jgi:hypothetical protein